jgi:hypothetical protein
MPARAASAAARRERAARYTRVPDLPLASWQKLCWLMNKHGVDLLVQAMRFQQIVDILETRTPDELRRIRRDLKKKGLGPPVDPYRMLPL